MWLLKRKRTCRRRAARTRRWHLECGADADALSASHYRTLHISQKRLRSGQVRVRLYCIDR